MPNDDLNKHVTSLRLNAVEGGWQLIIGGTDMLLIPKALAEGMAKQILGSKKEALPALPPPDNIPQREYVYVRHVGWRIKGTEKMR